MIPRLRVDLLAVFLACAFFTDCATPRSNSQRSISSDGLSTGRSFPSIFQAWSPVENLPQPEAPEQSIARHDLYFTGWGALGLNSINENDGLADAFTPESIQAALAKRARLLKLNPHLIIIAEVRYYDAGQDYLPPNSPWWKRDSSGQRIPSGNTTIAKSFYLDFGNPSFQAQVANQCAALSASRVVDGCMFDWWGRESQERVSLIKRVREKIGDSALLLVNANGNRPIQSAPYVNGIYMEGLGAKFFPDWKTAAGNMIWAAASLRKPNFTALEGWYSNSRADLKQARFVTALSLIFSDGYVLFGDPNSLPTPDHLHDWYSFWEQKIGQPRGLPLTLDQASADGTYTREFSGGRVKLNPRSQDAEIIRISE